MLCHADILLTGSEKHNMKELTFASFPRICGNGQQLRCLLKRTTKCVGCGRLHTGLYAKMQKQHLRGGLPGYLFSLFLSFSEKEQLSHILALRRSLPKLTFPAGILTSLLLHRPLFSTALYSSLHALHIKMNTLFAQSVPKGEELLRSEIPSSHLLPQG